MRHPFPPAGLLAIILLLALPVPGFQPVSAQTPADVAISLAVEISDADEWLGFQESLLGTPNEAPKPLTITVPSKTGGMKSIVLSSAKFESVTHPNARSVTVVVMVWGKMAGVPALQTLGLFQQAVFDMQAGTIENDVALIYGMFGVNGRLTEFKVTSR